MKYHLPFTLANWPYSRRINPHYANVKPEAKAWVESFTPLNPKAQEAFNRCDFNLLASLAYPDLLPERLRTACDLMNLFFIFEEYSDDQTSMDVQNVRAAIMRGLRSPDKPHAITNKASLVGEMYRQFWCRATARGHPVAHQRFVDAFDLYTTAVVEEAVARESGKVHNGVNEYLALRRDTIGTKPSFALLEFDQEEVLPLDVIRHPSVQELVTTATDMLSIDNDICSFNVEQARGDIHNIVIVVMHSQHLSLSSALTFVESIHARLLNKFIALSSELPSWGEPIDSRLANYIAGLGNWVRANDAWCFESERYFGCQGREVQAHRIVTILPSLVPPRRLPDYTDWEDVEGELKN
ncbi:terpenoid synthase [Panus rudis PR-1116 ss-1]|nr:terpenoid synthase [Panus rudis PR-1116 ss-1]